MSIVSSGMNTDLKSKKSKLQPSVFICVLNYGKSEQTIACVDSLKALDYPQFTVVIIDNHSPDDSAVKLSGYVQQLKAEGFSAHFIASHENKGYSGGNNLGIKYAQANNADYVWLLNNDTTVEPNALLPLVQEGERTGGLVGSLLLYPDRSYQQVGTTLNWWTGKVKGIEEQALQDGMRLESLSGASMLVSAKVLRRVGLLDESYFLYFEDGDYCLRASQKKCPVTLALRSRVYHQEGGTTGKHSLLTQYYYHRNRLLLMKRFASPLQFLAVLGYSVFRLFRSQIKAMSGDQARKQSAKIHRLAFLDFIAGKQGKAPHNFDTL